MKLHLLTILFFSCITVVAQELSIKNFYEATNDLSARTKPRQDNNGADCALVKVQIAASGVTFAGNVIGETSFKSNEYWVYMTEGSKRLKVVHPSYLPLEVTFADYDVTQLKSRTTYILAIKLGDLPQGVQQPKIQTGWIILDSEPTGASVFINEEFVGNTPLTNYKQAYGTYSFRVEHPNYHHSTGTIELNSGKIEQIIKLKPAFGSIAITCNVEGANILLDGKATNKMAPCTLEEVPSGQHTITIQKDKYSPQQQSINVKDGQTTQLSISLDARFAQISITSLNGAQIYCNGKQLGITKLVEDMMEGYYDIEVKLNHHKPAYKQIQVQAGQPQEMTINPTPIYGSLDITSTPHDADVTIDGKQYGKTPLTIEKLLEGEHTIILKKEDYSTESLSVIVHENETVTSSVQLQPYSEKIQVKTDRGGELSAKLQNVAKTIKKLSIIGYMDARDFDFIKNNCKQLQYLDISGVIIVEYVGRNGTDKNTQSYKANEIPLGAFFHWSPIDRGMPSLIEITLPKGIKHINRNAFARANNLRKINIPEGVKSIGFVAFALCTSLEKIELPSTLSEVGPLAFNECRNLSSVTIKSVRPPLIRSDSFNKIKPNAILYVPIASIDEYKKTVWSKFFNITGIVSE